MTDPRPDRDALKLAWITRLGTLLLRALAFTWRIRWINREIVGSEHEHSQPVMYVLWHGQLLPLLWTHRERQIAVMISEHRDGEMIARVAQALGFRTVRGSTTRGAARALLGACRELESGFDVAVTLDGPRGPAGTIAPGALVISQRTGAPMVPVAASASSGWRLRSWDRFLIPKPFARITVAYDAAIRVRSENPRDAVDEAEVLRAGMDRASATAGAEPPERQ